jgi:glycosyltransferase involved in cell wall biosynthesis
MKQTGKDTASRIAVMLMTRDLDQGGVQRDVAKMATHLDPRRFEPHVATYFTGGIRHQELRAAGIPVLHLPVGAVISAGGLRAAIRLGLYIREHRIQVLHAYDPTAILGVPVARSLNLPAVISSQLSYRDIMDWKTRFLIRWTDPFADAVVVNCEAMRQHMVEGEGVPASRVQLCYNGVDTSQFYPAEEVKPEVLAGASLVVGTVCALRPEKGLLLLQEAFAAARKPVGVKLLIVGSGEELPRLESRARELGIVEASVFVPATTEVPRWLRAIDIFALPSLSEAFSNSLLEAMACGCAVIGSRVGGTPELIGKDEERGFLFSVGDTAELARKLSILMGSESLRRDFAARAANFASNNLTVEIAARCTGELYDRLLDRNRA